METDHTPTTDSKNSSEDWEDKFKAFRGSCTCSGPKLSCSSCPSNDSYISFIQHIAKEEYERGFEFGQKVGRKGAVEFIKKEMQLDKSASPTTVLMLPLNVLEAALETPSNPT